MINNAANNSPALLIRIVYSPPWIALRIAIYKINERSNFKFTKAGCF